MKLAVWDELGELERRMDDLVLSFLGPRVRLTRPVLPLFFRRPFVPTTDVFARDDDIVVRVELPGIDPATDVTMSVEDGHPGDPWRAEAGEAGERGGLLPDGGRPRGLRALHLHP